MASVLAPLAIVLAPFYLVFTHDSDFKDKEIIPIYTSMDDCNKQAAVVDNIMNGRATISISKYVSNSNPHAFCISTGWSLDKTGGIPFGATNPIAPITAGH